jgi:hypothetical protein
MQELQHHEINLGQKLQDPAAYPQEQRPYMRSLIRAVLAPLDRVLQEYERDLQRRQSGCML